MKKKVELVVECLTIHDKDRPQFRVKRDPEHMVIVWKQVDKKEPTEPAFFRAVCETRYKTREDAVAAYKRLTE